MVQFSKRECNVLNNKREWIVRGLRTTDKYYGIESSTTLNCNRAKLDEVELWHQCLQHLNFKDLSKFVKKEFILGLPKLGKIEKVVCGPC